MYSWGRFAAQREQAPSPKARRLFAQLAQFIRLDHPHPILFFQRQAPHRAGQLAGFDAAIFAGNQP
jgi:hypothetical protein